MSQARRDWPGADGTRDPASLEQLLDQLDSAVRRLADQSAPLERMVADWERAQALACEAERRLDDIERGIRREPEPRPPAGGGGNGPAA